MQDDAHPHVAGVVPVYLNYADISILENPQISPNLNPLKNLKHYVPAPDNFR